MKFADYCKDRLLLLMLHIACMMLLTAFLIATAYPPGCCCLILLTWLIVLTAWFLTEYFRRKRYFEQMEAILEQADRKYLLGELMPASFRLEDRLYREMIRRSNKSVIERIRSVEDAGQEYREYIESWVHEIKAPIADIYLLCERRRDDTARRILAQNRRTENYVDMALFYARSDQVYQDYLIREATLQQTAEEVLLKNKYALIENHIRASVHCPDTVYTDAKWIAFILEQLVLNAVKYRRDTEPVLRISTARAGRNVLLTVEDNGCGIPEEELPRIFDKGFTGTNGRSGARATGMGLYLCRKLCVKLGIQILAESVAGAGTRISLEFPVSDYLWKVQGPDGGQVL